MKKTILLILVAFCLTGCDYWFGCNKKDRQVLLVYFAGNNSLSAEGSSDLSDIMSSYLPSERETEKIVLAFCHFVDKTPVLKRLYTDSRGFAVEEIIQEYPFNTNSASATTLSTVLADAEAAYPADKRGLILWSHATGFLPEGYYAHPKETATGDDWFDTETDLQEDPFAHLVKAGVKSFAEDHGSEMEIPALCSALSPYHFDFLLFDCCLMANVEVAYELRDCCDYILFSPTEILSDGFPYKTMVEPIFTQSAEKAMITICQNYMNHYRAQSGIYRSATISLVKTQMLGQLAAACKPIFQNHRDQILVINRSDIQPYFRFNKHWFYDIDDLVGRVATEGEYETFHTALEGAVIYKDATEQFLSIDIVHYSGLSIYIPRADYTVLNNYYKTLQWNMASGLIQ